MNPAALAPAGRRHHHAPMASARIAKYLTLVPVYPLMNVEPTLLGQRCSCWPNSGVLACHRPAIRQSIGKYQPARQALWQTAPLTNCAATRVHRIIYMTQTVAASLVGGQRQFDNLHNCQLYSKRRLGAPLTAY